MGWMYGAGGYQGGHPATGETMTKPDSIVVEFRFDMRPDGQIDCWSVPLSARQGMLADPPRLALVSTPALAVEWASGIIAELLLAKYPAEQA